MLALMATRQSLTLLRALRLEDSGAALANSGGLTELPGLVVSVLAMSAVLTLQRFLAQREAQYERIRGQETELLQAQRTQALGQLAGGVSHDFNNLLSVIQGNLELARLEGPLPASVSSSLDQIELAVKRGGKLTRRFLDFARSSPQERQRMDLNEVVNDLRPMLRRLLPERIELVFLLAESLPFVWIDPDEIGQVFVNLVVNSRDAINDNGVVTIRTETYGSEIGLSVEDTGAGMTEEVVRQAFDSFFTTKESDRGTGLGLAICHDIVIRNEGRIAIDSEPGTGTTVRIMLPVSCGAVSSASLKVVEVLPSGAGETIMLVEDVDVLRQVASSNLRALGYRVLESVNGSEALTLLEAHPECSLILSDVVMPHLGGLELKARLAELEGSPPVILMSGYNDGSSAREVLLEKPFTREQLARAVDAALRSRG